MPWWPDDPVGRFVLRLALWLLPCFAFWYLLANALLTPLATLVDAILQLTMPQSFRGLELSGRVIEFDTRLVLHTEDGRSGSPTFALNPLSYTWNLPVLAALLLAGKHGQLPRRLLLGYALLLPAWAWGLCWQFAKTLAFDLGPEIAQQFGEPGLWLEPLALAYQFGVLVLPATALALVWLLLGRDELSALTGLRVAPPLEREAAPPSRAQRRRRDRARKARRRSGRC